MGWYGAIEAGGTKFLCGVADSQRRWLDQIRIETRDPADTLQQVADFFRPHLQRQPARALGVASFGPVDLDVDSASYGHITTTPKPGWAHTDLFGPMRDLFQAPAAIDTDVNAAALAEYLWGSARGCDPVVYITVGTGVGGGVVVHGRPVHGLVHPEIGHMRVPRLRDDSVEKFAGHCPFHGDCIEGLCSGPAIAARTGHAASELPPKHPEWSRLARYLAQFAANLILTLSPQKLIFGGGVMAGNPHLLTMIRRQTVSLLNGYLPHPQLSITDPAILPAQELITAPALTPAAGLWGALALAMTCARPGAVEAATA